MACAFQQQRSVVANLPNNTDCIPATVQRCCQLAQQHGLHASNSAVLSPTCPTTRIACLACGLRGSKVYALLLCGSLDAGALPDGRGVDIDVDVDVDDDVGVDAGAAVDVDVGGFVDVGGGGDDVDVGGFVGGGGGGDDAGF